VQLTFIVSMLSRWYDHYSVVSASAVNEPFPPVCGTFCKSSVQEVSRFAFSNAHVFALFRPRGSQQQRRLHAALLVADHTLKHDNYA
jgi:hypothetical protein